MRACVRVNALLLGAALLLALAYPVAAAAEADHESTGRIVAVDGKSLVLDRRGDRISFRRASGVEVQGARDSWGDLSKGDLVTVHWNLSDTPKKAYRVDVMRSGD